MDPTIEVLHLVLAYLAAGAVVAGVGWSAGLALLDGAGGPNFDRFQAGIVSVFVVAAASGGVLLALGARPVEPGHAVEGDRHDFERHEHRHQLEARD